MAKSKHPTRTFLLRKSIQLLRHNGVRSSRHNTFRDQDHDLHQVRCPQQFGEIHCTGIQTSTLSPKVGTQLARKPRRHHCGIVTLSPDLSHYLVVSYATHDTLTALMRLVNLSHARIELSSHSCLHTHRQNTISHPSNTAAGIDHPVVVRPSVPKMVEDLCIKTCKHRY